MDEFKLYVVSLRYIEYLRQYEPTKILSSIGDHYVHDRKYLGIVYSIGGYNFFAPSYTLISLENMDMEASGYFVGKIPACGYN